MKPSTKGAFLSGLVYPGTGQMYFGRIVSGLVCISLVTLGLGVLIYRFAKRIYLVLDRAQPMWDNNTLGFEKFIKLMNQTEYSGWNVELISLGVVFLFWIASIAHAFYLGKNVEALKSEIDSTELVAGRDPKSEIEGPANPESFNQRPETSSQRPVTSD